MKNKLRRPSVATVLAFIALVAAIGGGTATARSLISSRDVRNGSLTGVDIKDHTITARDLSRSLIGRRAAGNGQKGEKGDMGLQGLPGVDGRNAVQALADDSKPAFPQQVDCRVELPPVNKNAAGDASEDQDDSGRSMINFNEQNTIDMNRIVTVGNAADPTTTQTAEDQLELSCWQPKRTGKGDGVVITGIKLSLLRIDQNTNLNPDVPPLGINIGPDSGTPRVLRNFQFNNGDERVLIKGIFQDSNDAEANGVPNPTKEQLATGIVDIPIDPTKTFADCTTPNPCHALPQGRYQLLAHVRTDKVRRSTDVDKTGKPTTQAPHVQSDENAEPLQSPTLQP